MLRDAASRHVLPVLLVLALSLAAPFVWGGRDDVVVVRAAESIAATAASVDGAGSARADIAFAVGSPAFESAESVAIAYWGKTPCAGDVELAWTRLTPDTNATASWRNPTDAWNNVDENFDCRIDLNPQVEYDFAKLCTVMAHELGHLLGNQHSAVDGDLMSAIYSGPIQPCIDADPNPAASSDSSDADDEVAAAKPRKAPVAKSSYREMVKRVIARKAAERRAALAAAKRCLRQYRAGKRSTRCAKARSRAAAAKRAKARTARKLAAKRTAFR